MSVMSLMIGFRDRDRDRDRDSERLEGQPPIYPLLLDCKNSIASSKKCAYGSCNVSMRLK